MKEIAGIVDVSTIGKCFCGEMYRIATIQIACKTTEQINFLRGRVQDAVDEWNAKARLEADQ